MSALSRIGTAASVAAIGALLLERSAHAGPCSSLPAPVLVIESGDTQEPLLKALGQKLRNSATPMTVLYKTTGTCTLTDDMYKGKVIAQSSNLSYLPTIAEDPLWNTSLPSPTCSVDAVGGLPIDVAIGATFISSCTTDPPPAGMALITGGIQAYTFVVPKASTQTAITAEEGYFTFGFGKNGQAQPWVDEQFLFVRTSSKSTALTLAAAINVPVTKLKGVAYDKSTEVLNSVATSPNPDKTIGLLGAELFDANREKVTVLAFRGFKQRYAYYPDSTTTSFDKRNVRDGHYLPWAPTPYITRVDGAGEPTNPQAKTFIDLVRGKTTLPDVDGMAVSISKGLIPECAMKVTRQADGADLSLYSHPEPCGCYFESKVPNGSTKCTACTDDTPCNGGKCRRNFCEAR